MEAALEMPESVRMQVGMIQNRERNQRWRREGDNCNNNILEKARDGIQSKSSRVCQDRSRDTPPIATGQSQIIYIEMQEGSRSADGKEDVFIWLLLFLQYSIRQGHELRERIRRGGIGGLRASENIHFEDWESIDLYSKIAARKIYVPIWDLRLLNVWWDHPASSVFLQQCSTTVCRSEREYTKWRLVEWINFIA